MPISAQTAIECREYGVRLSPWHCIENQLSLYCLPGWPCETCELAVSIRIAGGDPGAHDDDVNSTTKALNRFVRGASSRGLFDFYQHLAAEQLAHEAGA